MIPGQEHVKMLLLTLFFLGFELLSVAMLFPEFQIMEGNRTQWILIFHLCAVFCFMILSLDLLPEQYQQDRIMSCLLILGVSLCLPFVGPVAICLIFQNFHSPPENLEKKCSFIVGDRELSGKKVQQNQDPWIKGSVIDIMNKGDVPARRNAVLALRHVNPWAAIPILQKGGGDRDELVRIFSQKILNETIESLEKKISDLENKSKERNHDSLELMMLAELYHEIVYLRLVEQPEIEFHYLRNAANYLRQAIQLNPKNLPARFFILKIFLKLWQTERAARELKALADQGFPYELLVPWELEVHYQRNDWSALENAFKNLHKIKFLNPSITLLAKVWLRP